jgi:hypothetical protein
MLKPGEVQDLGTTELAAGSLSVIRSGTEETVATVEREADGRFTAALPKPGVYIAIFSRLKDGIENARKSAEQEIRDRPEHERQHDGEDRPGLPSQRNERHPTRRGHSCLLPLPS